MKKVYENRYLSLKRLMYDVMRVLTAGLGTLTVFSRERKGEV